MKYVITDIEYDAENTSDLPKELEIEVDVDLSACDKIEFISERISEITDRCHFGFSTTPEINE